MRGHGVYLLYLGGLAMAHNIPRQAQSTASGTPTLASINPTAIPISSIYASMSTQPTVALDTTYAAGATPPVSGAPPLPTPAIVASKYPALDQIPPINSPEVQQWIKDVQNSGVAIPGFAATQTGGCSDPANAAAVANASASGTCWWTCGGCTRDTDITTCPDPKTWGMSFDDGPSPYTPNLLQYLDQQNLKSTFFIVGSRAISRPEMVQTEYMGGHQLSVHTWSHPSLTTLTNEQIIAELGWTKKAMKDITGVTPNTMRPPYGDIDDRVRAICKAMGLTPIIWTSAGGSDFDTNDWHIPSGLSSETVLSSFETILSKANSLNTGFIVLSHDLYQQTVDIATGYIVPDALARGFQLKNIISCLKKPLSEAYIETSSNTTSPASTGTLAVGSSGAAASSTATPNQGSSSSGSTTSKNDAQAFSIKTPLLLFVMGLCFSLL
ncbi:polysaccharide deacetylase from carbohydrate esterase family CE10 protein, putative [Rhizoctonia solani AG-3 Rhs1AP]|uniref:chitin deacetylase n=1 Tax=Rhizoctonia solani AG-3 Rhs1AP TaxID=1086054 RepID=A0A0A1UHX0_9AGAM|nr:polysaccharide deacetylase from carbohydrate esterase family CE10 protein, putative [Rhizoctonia solani AG-3 Rhs1AP]